MSQRIVISIEVPDGVTVQVANGSAAPVVANGGTTPSCPKHGADKVKPSRKGPGFFCSAHDDSTSNGYCAWHS